MKSLVSYLYHFNSFGDVSLTLQLGSAPSNGWVTDCASDWHRCVDWSGLGSCSTADTAHLWEWFESVSVWYEPALSVQE